MDSMASVIASFSEAHRLVGEFVENPEQLKKVTQFAQMIVDLYQRDGNLFTCGNGGSHCDAMHFAEEFTGRYRKDRRALGALPLGDSAHLSCVANDFGFEQVFARQVEGLGRKGDMLVGITTSGKSKNVGLALEKAKEKGLVTVCLSGRDGGFLKGVADLEIIVPAKTPERVQEMHIKIIHSVIEAAERQLFPEHYA